MTPTLDPTLSALLDRHGVPQTVDGLLAAFEGRRRWHRLIGDSLSSDTYYWRASIESAHMSILTYYGDSPLTALARAFAAMVESEEQS